MGRKVVSVAWRQQQFRVFVAFRHAFPTSCLLVIQRRGYSHGLRRPAPAQKEVTVGAVTLTGPKGRCKRAHGSGPTLRLKAKFGSKLKMRARSKSRPELSKGPRIGSRSEDNTEILTDIRVE
ncbi:hypothetical protein EVAR_21488_1 [Eumeta japonica]|uniref:Uncharacterized protein n=1 Tax=Eumeta variegata TaxID=151549 RepID=A0A4C1UXM2_EUMVA|nr:hypothetical protein EVAR_21488_1 [Eumeta japonica]